MAYSLASASTPGFTTFTQKTTGRKFTACVCTAEWLPLLEQMAIKRGIIHTSLDIIQVVGGDPKSGGTHVQGAAIDVEQVGLAFVTLCREAGAHGTWSRYPPAFPNDHTHITLTGCPHDGPCAYQTAAQARGYNGLGQGTKSPYVGMWGYGGKDPFPAVSPRRTWSQGVAWMKSQLAPPAPVVVKPPTLAPKTNEVIEVTHQTFAGPQNFIPVVVPNDKRQYQVDMSIAAGDVSSKVTLMTFARKSKVTDSATLVRSLSWQWGRDIPGTITLQAGEGHLSISFDGTPDQRISIALTPTGKML